MYDEHGMPSEDLITHWNERNDHADDSDHDTDDEQDVYTPRTVPAIDIHNADNNGTGIRLYLTGPDGANVPATVVTTGSYPGRVVLDLTSHDLAALCAAARRLNPLAEEASDFWSATPTVVRLGVPSHTRLTLAPESVGWRFTDHDKALGGWCSWSYSDVYDLGRRFALDDWRCPERCPTSGVVLHPRPVDPIDTEHGDVDADRWAEEHDSSVDNWHHEPDDPDEQEATPMPDTTPRRDRVGRTVARTGMIAAGVAVLLAALALGALLLAVAIGR